MVKTSKAPKKVVKAVDASAPEVVRIRRVPLAPPDTTVVAEVVATQPAPRRGGGRSTSLSQASQDSQSVTGALTTDYRGAHEINVLKQRVGDLEAIVHGLAVDVAAYSAAGEEFDARFDARLLAAENGATKVKPRLFNVLIIFASN